MRARRPVLSAARRRDGPGLRTRQSCHRVGADRTPDGPGQSDLAGCDGRRICRDARQWHPTLAFGRARLRHCRASCGL